jgi:hypothetical protein
VTDFVNYLIARRRQAGQPDSFVPAGFAIAAAQRALVNRPDPWIGPPAHVRPVPLSVLPPTTGAVTS